MTDLRQRISDVLCNRLSDFDVSDGRFVDGCRWLADNLTETLMALDGITIVDTEAIYPVARAIFANRRHHEPVRAWEDLYSDEMDSYRAMARAALTAAVQAQEEQ